MITHIHTNSVDEVKPFLKNLYIPPSDSHKGQNGKVLVIGGSELFHAASIWAADMIAHMVDMVHYASTPDNNEIIKSLKTKFTNGIVINRNDIPAYVTEDDVVLLGPGMVRTPEKLKPTEDYMLKSLNELAEIEHEGIQTYYITKYLLSQFKEKRWVIDAGALQMMEMEWLQDFSQKPIITPHIGEFERLFEIEIAKKSDEEKVPIVEHYAKKYSCVILLKSIVDIVSDGEKTFVIHGGNAGLTKGGTGDTLAGLVASLYTKNDSVTSAVMASFLLKKSADTLFSTQGLWYNTDDLINKIPSTFREIAL